MVFRRCALVRELLSLMTYGNSSHICCIQTAFRQYATDDEQLDVMTGEMVCRKDHI